MSRTLMQHVRVLVMGVALIAMILTIAPDVANAKTKLDGKVDAALNDGGGDGGANKGDGGKNQGDGGEANLDGKVDAVLKGDAGGNLGDKADAALKKGDAGTTLDDATVDSATSADQRVDLDAPPLVGGDIKSINEVNSDLVPAKGEAKADGNIKAGELIDERFCVRGALNQSASGCGGGPTPADGSTGGGNGDMVTTPDIDTEAALGDNVVNSDTVSNQHVDFDNSPLVGGDTNSTTEVIAPLVPAEGEAKVDKKVEMGDLINEDICLNAALNRNAGSCGGGTPGSIPGGGDTVTVPNINIDEVLGDNAVNHDTEIKEDLLPDDDTLLDGAVDSVTQVTAPALPVEGGAKVDGNVNAADKVKQDICLSADLNRNGTGCGSGGAGGSGDDIVTIPDIDRGEIPRNIDADSDTTIDENVNPDNLQQNGAVDNTNGVDAPAVPASAKAKLIGNANVGEMGEQNLNNCTTLNAECGGDSAAAPDNGGSGSDLSDPLADIGGIDANSDTLTGQQVNDDPLRSDGNTTSNTDVEAPAVPASAKVEGKGNVEAPGLVNQDVGLCGTLNAENCGGNTASAPGNGGIDLGESYANLGDTTADSNTTIDQQANDDPLQSNGNTIGNADVVAPAVPASPRTEFDTNGTLGHTVDQDGSVCGSVNSENCSGDDPAPAPGSEGNDIDLGDPVGGLDGTNVDSGTIIDENVNPNSNESVVDGAADNTNNIVAPTVPASGTANLDGSTAEDDLASQGINSCTDLNTENCGGDAAASPDGGAGINIGDLVANLNANAVPDGGVILGADAALSGDAATPAGSDAVLRGDAGGTLSGDAAVGSDAEPISASGDVALRSDVSLSGVVDRAPVSDDAVTTLSDGAALNGDAGSAPAGDDTTLGVDAALSSDAGTTLSGDTRTALRVGAEPVPAGSDTVPAGDDASIIISDILGGEVDTPLTGSDAAIANADADTVPAGGNDVGPGKLAIVNTNTDTTAVPSGKPTSTADPSDNRTQNLAAGPSKSRFRTLAGSPFSDWNVALAASPSGGEGKDSASSGSGINSGDRLPDTGGVSPLVLIAALLLVGLGALLIARRRLDST